MTPEVFWRNVKVRMGYMRVSDLAKASGLSAGTLRARMRLNYMPDAMSAIAIARALGCTVEDLAVEAVPV